MIEPSSASNTVITIVFALMLLGIGSCVYAGRTDPSKQMAATPQPMAPKMSIPTPEAKATKQPKKRSAKAERITPNDLDDADKAIALAINLSGHLCAKPIEVAPTGSPGLYAVRCITHRSGEGLADYLVNSRTNHVSEM